MTRFFLLFVSALVVVLVGAAGCIAHHEVVASPDHVGMVSGDARDVSAALDRELSECTRREQAAAGVHSENAGTHALVRGIVAGVGTAAGTTGVVIAYVAQGSSDTSTKDALAAVGGSMAAVTPLVTAGAMQLVGIFNWETLSLEALAKAKLLQQRKQEADRIFGGLMSGLNSDQNGEPFKTAMTGASALVASSAAACRE